MLFDVHSHIIPRVDDGSRSVEESLKILEEMRRQGIDRVLATPHFYASEMPFEEYMEKIERQYTVLQQAAAGKKLPEILLGYEVYYFRGISDAEEIRRLTINGSRFLLLELPYQEITGKIADEVEDLAINQAIVPVLAHVDRYYRYGRIDPILALLEKGEIRGHVNADSLLDLHSRRKSLQLLESGLCRYLGSDAHHMNSRAPHMEEAMAYLEKKKGLGLVKRIRRESDAFFEELLDR